MRGSSLQSCGRKFKKGSLEHYLVTLIDLSLSKFGFIFSDEESVYKRIGKALWIGLNNVYLFYCCFQQFDPNGGILDTGKFINLLVGVTLSFTKTLFVWFHRKDILTTMARLEGRATRRQDKFKESPEIQEICERFFVKQRNFLFCVPSFELPMMTFVLFESMFPEPKKLVLGDYKGVLGSPHYYITNVLQFISSSYTDMNFLVTDLLVGGIYLEVVKELDIIRHELLELSQKHPVSTEAKHQRLRQIILSYQEVTSIQRDFTGHLTGFLGTYLGCVLFVFTFVCVELAILMNENPSHAAEPFFYLIFMNVNLFYWCWLGNLLVTQSEEISRAAFVYDPEVDDKGLQKMLVIFQQMLRKPLKIRVPPFFVFDYQLFLAILQISYKFTTIFKEINQRHE